MSTIIGEKQTTAGSVLVLEDEMNVARLIASGLSKAEFIVTGCEDGERGYELAMKGGFSAVILDILLPGRNGLEVLRDIRAAGNSVPVILLTAKSAVEDKIEGLRGGADDYLIKPFSMDELVERLHAILRRNRGEKEITVLKAGLLELNLVLRKVTFKGELAELTQKEFSLLELLLRNKGKVLTRTYIISHLWGYQFDPGTNIVDVVVRRLRKKLNDDGCTPLVKTVRGKGYVITDEK